MRRQEGGQVQKTLGLKFCWTGQGPVRVGHIFVRVSLVLFHNLELGFGKLQRGAVLPSSSFVLSQAMNPEWHTSPRATKHHRSSILPSLVQRSDIVRWQFLYLTHLGFQAFIDFHFWMFYFVLILCVIIVWGAWMGRKRRDTTFWGGGGGGLEVLQAAKGEEIVMQACLVTFPGTLYFALF